MAHAKQQCASVKSAGAVGQHRWKTRAVARALQRPLWPDEQRRLLGSCDGRSGDGIGTLHMLQRAMPGCLRCHLLWITHHQAHHRRVGNAVAACTLQRAAAAAAIAGTWGSPSADCAAFPCLSAPLSCTAAAQNPARMQVACAQSLAAVPAAQGRPRALGKQQVRSIEPRCSGGSPVLQRCGQNQAPRAERLRPPDGPIPAMRVCASPAGSMPAGAAPPRRRSPGGYARPGRGGA